MVSAGGEGELLSEGCSCESGDEQPELVERSETREGTLMGFDETRAQRGS